MKKYNTRQTLDNWLGKKLKKGTINKMEAKFKKQPQDAEQRTNDKNIRAKYIKGTIEE
jgi:hypothetical protein